MLKRAGWFVVLSIFLIASSARTQPPAPASPQTPARDEGIPVQNDLVRARCGSCHRSDDQGRMSRISYRRATAENWERTIKRMVTLNKVNLTPEDARVILKYLADKQGLAPEKLCPTSFEAQRRSVQYT